MRRSTYAICAIILAAFGACWYAADNQPQPEVRLVTPPGAPIARYICSVTGDEAVAYQTHTGEVLDPIPTGRHCDYQAYRALSVRRPT